MTKRKSYYLDIRKSGGNCFFSPNGALHHLKYVPNHRWEKTTPQPRSFFSFFCAIAPYRSQREGCLRRIAHTPSSRSANQERCLQDDFFRENHTMRSSDIHLSSSFAAKKTFAPRLSALHAPVIFMAHVAQLI